MNLENNINENVIPWLQSIAESENLMWKDPKNKIESDDCYSLEWNNKDKILRLFFYTNQMEYTKVWNGGHKTDDGFEIGIIDNQNTDSIIFSLLKWVF